MGKNSSTLSRLGLLMNSLDVSGKDLATALHVDDSLVSKWKNNHRPLTPDSPYLSLIAQILLDAEKKRGTKVINMLFTPFANTENLVTKKAKINCLCQWLTGHTPAQNPDKIGKKPSKIQDLSSYNTQTHIWQGNKGRRKAVLMFLSQTLLMPKPIELLLVSQEPLNWLTEDQAFLRKWQKLLIEILHKGHKIQIIHSVNRSLASLDSILDYWLPLHLTGQVKSWFHPVYGDLPYYLTMFIAKKSMVLSSITPSKLPGPVSTTLAHDPLSLAQYTAIFDSLVEDCQELIKIYPTPDFLTAIEESIAPSLQLGDIFIFSQNLIFTTMPRQLLKKVLNDNRVDPFISNRLLNYYDSYHNMAQTSAIHYRVSHMEIAEYLSQGTSLNIDLSRFAKKEIYLTQNQRIQHIEHLVESLRTTDHFKVGLSPYENPAEILVTENKSVVAWSQLPELSQIAMVVEPTVVRAFYEHLRASWNKIPRVYRNKKEVIDRLKHHLSNVKIDLKKGKGQI